MLIIRDTILYKFEYYIVESKIPKKKVEPKKLLNNLTLNLPHPTIKVRRHTSKKLNMILIKNEESFSFPSLIHSSFITFL